ncbi:MULTISPECIES: hypothetical protein [unclassified Bosea (in: a-proteobacteria)]|uniref:hypothetical protein n=1 Tax=unclassified Bosea (in: a-proteobacteria) TaxID=2653178 RepID=UPI000953C949|nr:MULTISPECIES: hypothetical protein [unclassified Bosea (in: a-proteobacteria)]TAJ27791.1 MAG: hypothetical protein EPO59_20760 [Bosea sp. (in: a-proteobacteria)]SIQ09740.1 hypothetical protein SAMN05880592_101900 [Bosea sp. TND4EK4]
MDEDRIKRIARAMCRAARLDPDKPAEKVGAFRISMQAPDFEGPQPAWMLFRQEAARFAALNREVVQSL